MTERERFDRDDDFARRQSEYDYRFDRMEQSQGRIEDRLAKLDKSFTEMQTRAGAISFLIALAVSICGVAVSAWKALKNP